jgi:uncharacterized protein (UPF0276 family)
MWRELQRRELQRRVRERLRRLHVIRASAGRTLPCCVGLGWRPETSWLIDSRPRAAFSEVIAETVDPRRPPRALAAAVERGLVVVTHGVGLSLGGATPPEPARVRRLAAVAKTLRSPWISEHVAFARAGRTELGHFLPVVRSRAQLAVLIDHVRRVMDALPVPLALENVAAPLTYPGDELAEAEFLAELLDRTGAHLLLDVANLYANLVNHGGDAAATVARLPLDRVAYLHVAGGARVDVMWRDTHAHAIAAPALDLLRAVLARTGPRPILLERDHAFGGRPALEAELDQLEAVLASAMPIMATTTRGAFIALPDADQATREGLARAHGQIARCAVDPTVPPPPGISPLHLAETRSILGGKRARSPRSDRAS